MPSIMQRLRAATRTQHAALEATPFFEALRGGQLVRASYVAWLRVLHTVHETLEAELSGSSDPWVRAVWRADDRRAPLLERDLAHFESDSLAGSERAQLCAIAMARELRYFGLSDPAGLLGALYVLEGAAFGGQLMRAQIGACFGLDEGVGLEYLTGRGRETAARFAQFGARMDGFGFEFAADEDVGARVVASAVSQFERFETILRALHPLTNEPVSGLVAILNPAAGSHAITDDLREIEAALRAGEASWQAFPYYERRYGARGRRFTASDSAWLVMLCDSKPDHVRDHVLWLGRVLAARGMPRLMLEEHLVRLHAFACAAYPDRRARYEPLLVMSAELQAARLRRLSASEQSRLALEFDGELAARVGLPRIGELIVAALADEHEGVQGAVSSLCDWLTDEQRFEASFVRAVRATLAAARRGRS